MTNIDTSELEYLKSCRDKLRDITDMLNKDEERSALKGKKEESLTVEEKLEEIEKIIKGNSSSRKGEKKR